jgi:phenylpropionate dioxygenase-like ring-hydroxylating dioxygenase large terminal subunit
MPKPDTLNRRDVTASNDVPATRRTGLHPDFWYPMARSGALKAGRTLAVSFAGEPIVLVRPENGSPYALEDRCAHRQVPLHLGVVRGEQLLCGYHCWTYDRTGHCVNVPYLDESRTLPNGVRRYACREAYGFVFVFPGDQSKADRDLVPLPELPRFSNARYRMRLLDRQIACHYSFMHENLMDMNHQFLHRSLMGKVRPTLLDVREGVDWIEADYTFSAQLKHSLGREFMVGRKSDQNADLMTIRTGYPYQTLRYWTPGNKEGDPALDLWNAYVPLDRAQSRNQTYGTLMVRKPKVPGLIHLTWPVILSFTEGIFGQDRRIVEAEQRAYEDQGGDLNQEIFPLIHRLKQLLARCGVPLADQATTSSGYDALSTLKAEQDPVDEGGADREPAASNAGSEARSRAGRSA